MPYDPSRCTHHDDIVRQQVFACLTCRAKDKQPSGICYSCSIQCHSDHDLVELFTKRNFRCDCGTTRMASFGGCNLRKNFDSLDTPADTNVYNHNFEGKFCVCDREYVPEKEEGVMFQCLVGDACGEDWFHEECILGIPYGSVDRSKAKEETRAVTAPTHPEGVNVFDQLESAHSEDVKAPDVVKEESEQARTEGDEDGEPLDEDATLDGLPNEDEFVAFVCWRCVDKHRQEFGALRRLPGTVVASVVRGDFSSIEDRKARLQTQESSTKRQLDETEADSTTKKIKSEDGTAASASITTATTTANIEPNAESSYSLFLADGFQDIVKQCDQPDVKRLAAEFRCLAEEEEVYEPPDDNDANSSLMDGGARALNQLPREQAIEGMHAYSMIRERLTSFLKPFAEQGRVVTKDDVDSFFADVKSQRKE